MKNLFNGFVVVALALIIWILFSINEGIHHMERQLESLAYSC